MYARPRTRLRLPFMALCACLLLAALPATAAQDKAREAEAASRLEAVKQQIQALAREQRHTGSQRDALDASIAEQARALASAAARVRETEAAVTARQHQLEQLSADRAAIAGRLDQQREALAQLLRAAYSLGRGSDLRLLLGDDDVARIARALAYSRYFQRDRSARIKALLQDLAQLKETENAITREKAALEAARAEQARRTETLAHERTQQQVLLKKAEAQLKDQAQRLAALKQDQKSLDELLARLRDVFADIPEALPADTPFAKLRGSLPWPARGAGKRSGDGLRIDAARGSDVHAVAHGRIAYADWLRGYGMLVIVDHGHGWLSLYGNNESLARGVGDWVDAGDVVGTAGADPGIYFELRHKRQPVDPRPWLAGKRR